jgi:hypothetical protein
MSMELTPLGIHGSSSLMMKVNIDKKMGCTPETSPIHDR